MPLDDQDKTLDWIGSDSDADETHFTEVWTIVDRPNWDLSRSVVLYNDLAHGMDPLLNLFNAEFSVLPLSMDIRDNPYRLAVDSYRRSPPLLHAVLALSFQHLAKQQNCSKLDEQTQVHRSAAMQGFSQALVTSTGPSLLDVLLNLVNLEISKSTLGLWNVHLRGAQVILEKISLPNVLSNTGRLRSQLAILLCWDTTVAFMSRTTPRLPQGYLVALTTEEDMDKSTFFALNGCPLPFMRVMWQLAGMAARLKQYPLLNFHDEVKALATYVKQWINSEAVSIEQIEDGEDDLDDRKDRYHCTEAWRYDILLYCQRVFVRMSDFARLREVDHLARSILDRVRCIRETTMIQKQALLPVYLAAAEAEQKQTRELVRRYCNHWSATARYSRFETALHSLEETWDTNSILPAHSVLVGLPS